MVRAIRAVSVERGHDPRDYTLMPFGGAGALHATEVARSLGISEILVPHAPGILCAQGLVVSDLTEDFVSSARIQIDDENIPEVQACADALHKAAATWFKSETIPPERSAVSLSLDMRYVGQNFELRVAAEDTSSANVQLPEAASLRALFFEAHETKLRLSQPAGSNRSRQCTFDRARPALTGHRRRKRLRRRRSNPPAVGTRSVWFDADNAGSIPRFTAAEHSSRATSFRVQR